jgi:hypothetical protein
MSVATIARHTGGDTTEEVRTGAPLKVFKLDGTSVDIPEEAGKTAQFYLDAADTTVEEGDVVYLDGRAITADTVVPTGEATHVITVTSEIACG